MVTYSLPKVESIGFPVPVPVGLRLVTLLVLVGAYLVEGNIGYGVPSRGPRQVVGLSGTVLAIQLLVNFFYQKAVVVMALLHVIYPAATESSLLDQSFLKSHGLHEDLKHD